MTLNNFSNGAERSVAEYYAGTMQPLSVIGTSVDASFSSGDPVPKHRRATRSNDHIAYCNQSAADAYNIYINNGVEQNVINVKVPSGLGAGYEYIGHWHLKSTKDGFQFFFPVVNTPVSNPQIQHLHYGEVRFNYNGVASIVYEQYREVLGPLAAPDGPPCGFVDVGQEVYFFTNDRFSIRVYNAYYPSVEEEATQPDMDYIKIDSTEYDCYGISSSDSDENFILFKTLAGDSMGFTVLGANEDYTEITIMPAQHVIDERDDEEPVYDVIRTQVAFGDPSTALSDDYIFMRTVVPDGNELPLWHSKRIGLASYDEDDEYLTVVKGNMSNYTGVYGERYVWIALQGGRAYIPFFNETDGYYYTASILGTSGQVNKTLKQKEYDSSYLPFQIPIEGDIYDFITYYSNANDHYYYLTKSLPSIIENDKGIFYPQFLGEEGGTVVLEEANYLRYERIGNIVHVFGVVQVDSSTGLGELKMNNLPYPISNEFTDVDFTLDQAFPKLTPIKQAGSDYYTLYFCASQSDQTLTSVATAVALTPRWVFNFRYMTN